MDIRHGVCATDLRLVRGLDAILDPDTNQFVVAGFDPILGKTQAISALDSFVSWVAKTRTHSARFVVTAR